MAIVTGDRYLNLLVSFIGRRAGQLLDGTLTLKLNPVGLHYVQSRLESLRELESLVTGAPVDYLRAYVSDLGDHRALEQLRRILRLLTSLKVVSVLPPAVRDPAPLSLLPFARLRVLELRGCDLSTTPARGLLELRLTLEKLICHNSTAALRHVFASRIADIKECPVWNKLSFVSCTSNGLVLMDESLQLLPVVETLDLSRNRFAKVDNLRMCTKLKHLDLGFNHLRTIACFTEVSCPIVTLILRNNALTTLRGLENLKSVAGLDLSYNIISSFSELEILASLPSLQNLWLEGNPICCARWYRAHVFSFFSQPENLKLDEKGISTREYWERHIIFANRQKRPAGYGFYFPAKDDAEDEGFINSKKKKHSRLASIEDDDGKRYFGSDAMDQESVSCDTESLRKDDNAISDGDSEILSLMNRVEYMKKERSDLWLREFKEWLVQNSGDTADGSQCLDFNLGPAEEKYVKQRKGRKHLGESFTNVSDTAQVSDDGSSSNILISDISFQDSWVGAHGNEYFDTNGKGIAELPVSNGGDFRGVSSEQGQLKVHSRVRHNLSPLELNGPSNHSSSIGEGSVNIEQKRSPTPFTAIGELIESRTSSLYPGSPPHYKQDILHRRLYLEEEFLQLSAGSLSVASSDSDTSCSDDESCRFHASNAELDRLLIEDSFEKGTGDHSDIVPDEDNNHDGDEEIPANQDKSFSPCDHPDDHSYEIDQDARQDAGSTEKRKGRRKPKKRVASLEENSVACSTKMDIENSNGILDINRADMGTKWKLSFEVNDICDSCEQASMIPLYNWKVKSSPTNDAHISLLKSKPDSHNSKLDDIVRDFFNSKVADFRVSETYQELFRCACISQVGPDFRESEVALLRSSKNNLCVVLLDAEPSGKEVNLKVLGCHRLEDLKQVVVGLGLQALRVYIESDTTYLFLPRTVEKFNDLLCFLQVCDSTALGSGCSLRSWEQVQVELLEKWVRVSLKMGIFFYSMLLFSHDTSGEKESWLPRSLFVIEGNMLVCCENLVDFGSSEDDCESSPPYYSLDSCCPIQNIIEMVIEVNEGKCLTLMVDLVPYGNLCSVLDDKEKQAVIWKLKWFSEDTLMKFVSLVKAIYSGLTSSPLPLKCIS